MRGKHQRVFGSEAADSLYPFHPSPLPSTPAQSQPNSNLFLSPIQVRIEAQVRPTWPKKHQALFIFLYIFSTHMHEPLALSVSLLCNTWSFCTSHACLQGSHAPCSSGTNSPAHFSFFPQASQQPADTPSAASSLTLVPRCSYDCSCWSHALQQLCCTS